MSDTEARTPKEISEDTDEPHIDSKMVGVYLHRMAKKGDVTQEGRAKFRRNTVKGGNRDE
jgi:hypothetical protein